MALVQLNTNVMNPKGWLGTEQVEVSGDQLKNWLAKGWCTVITPDEVEEVKEVKPTEEVKETADPVIDSSESEVV